MTTVPAHTSTIDGLTSPAVSAIKALENALNLQDTAGLSGVTFGGTGNLNVQAVTSAVQPASTAADYVLAVYTLPALALDQAMRSLQVVASGSFAATANNKRVKIIIGATTPTVGQVVSGGTAIADSGTVATNNAGWQLGATIIKTGALGANTQLTVHNQAQMGAAVSALLAPTALTQVENAPITFCVTGNAATAASDINFNYFEATFQD